MCNACGFLCCGSDEFGGCGCEHCGHPDCLPRTCWACNEPISDCICDEVDDSYFYEDTAHD